MQKKPDAVEDVESLFAAILYANERFQGQVWWRGQRSSASEWKLKASVFRRTGSARSEKSLIARFQYKAPSRHAKVPSFEDKAGWLFLMQHYRLPTRLLDWTESPLIASFFSAEIEPAAISHPKEIKDSDGKLFALSPYQLNQDQIGKRVLQLPHDQEADQVIRRAFEGSLGPTAQILAVRPSEVDSRLMVQLSVFTLHDTDRSIDELPSNSDFLLEFKVPKNSKKQLRRELKYLGVRESSIFPDLEHLATDVSATRFKPPASQESSDTGFDSIGLVGGEDSS